MHKQSLHKFSHRLLTMTTAFLIISSPNIIEKAKADEIDDCVSRLQSVFESSQQFSQEGEITCPAGDIVGFPPRIRRNDRSGVVAYTAPDGRTIVDRSINSINVINVSQNNGRFGTPSISSDRRTVSVPVSCDGKGPGEGRSWQKIQIQGSTIRNPTQDDLKSWILQCVRCVADKSCPR